YGRDRLAYQTYEQFFEPELPPRELPLANRYIRRMQATYALIDYLGVGMQVGKPTGSIWRDLAKPNDPDLPKAEVDALKPLLLPFPLQHQALTALRNKVLSRTPNDWDGVNWLQANIRRRHVVSLLADLIKVPNQTEELAQHLSHALNLPHEDVDALLWDHP